MSFLILILVFSVALAAMLALIGWRFFLVKDYKEEELIKGVLSAKPFFEDFEKQFVPAFKASARYLKCFFQRKEFGSVKRHYCRLSDYMHGRHSIKKNGCRGYWEELNDVKNGNGESEKKNDLPR